MLEVYAKKGHELSELNEFFDSTENSICNMICLGYYSYLYNFSSSTNDMYASLSVEERRDTLSVASVSILKMITERNIDINQIYPLELSAMILSTNYSLPKDKIIFIDNYASIVLENYIRTFDMNDQVQKKK